MVTLVVMAYVLSIQQGLEDKVEKKKIYKNKPSRLAISYFTQGLSIIKAKIWSLKRFIGVLNDILKMLIKENSFRSSSKYFGSNKGPATIIENSLPRRVFTI